jgi:hypothetical protein
MATVESLIAAVMAAIEADVTEVDYSDATSFLPAVTTQSVAMIAVPLGHSDEARDFSFGEIETIHRLRVQFWVRLVPGQEATAFPLARAINYRAMQALAAHDGTGYTLAVGDGGGMTGTVAEAIQDVNGAAYLLATLTVPVVQVETI